MFSGNEDKREIIPMEWLIQINKTSKTPLGEGIEFMMKLGTVYGY